MKAMSGAILLFGASACAAVPPEPAEGDVPPIEDSNFVCNAEPAQGLVGRTATTELGAEARRLAGAKSLRWIPEGSMVTMDYRPDRLNIELDGGNRVTRIRCG
jgi:hypothetical protein